MWEHILCPKMEQCAAPHDIEDIEEQKKNLSVINRRRTMTHAWALHEKSVLQFVKRAKRGRTQ